MRKTSAGRRLYLYVSDSGSVARWLEKLLDATQKVQKNIRSALGITEKMAAPVPVRIRTRN